MHTSFQVPEYTTYVNVMGAIKILETIKNFSPESKFYNASTSEMYGKVLEPIQNENTKFNPQSPYAISNFTATWLRLIIGESYNLFACSGILFNHESPRRVKRLLHVK